MTTDERQADEIPSPVFTVDGTFVGPIHWTMATFNAENNATPRAKGDVVKVRFDHVKKQLVLIDESDNGNDDERLA